ncbi:protein timeless homolog isoform X2 [Rhopilema esculentum]
MIRFLRHEDLQTCDIRRQMGHAKVLENDLVPLLISNSDDKELTDIVLRLLVNLTSAPHLCFEQNPIDEAKNLSAERKAHELQLTSYLQSYKEAFTNKLAMSAVSSNLGGILQKDPVDREEEDNLLLERILLLIRNLLYVPADPDNEKRTDDDVTVHDQLLWSLHENGIDDLLIYISGAENETNWCMHACEIFSYMFREQNAEELAVASEMRSIKEKEEDADVLKTTLAKERQAKLKMIEHRGSRHSRFGGSFWVKDRKALKDDEDLVYHRTLQSVKDMTYDFDKTPDKKRKLKMPLIERDEDRKSTLSVRLFLKEFCTKFLENGYNNLMSAVKSSIDSGKTQKNDESFYLIVMRFFMMFNRIHEFRVDYVSQTFGLQLFSFILKILYKNIDEYEMHKPTKGRDAKIQCSRRIHLALKAYKELLMYVAAMLKSKDTNLVSAAEVIENNIFYIEEYRNIFLSLLRTWNVAFQTRPHLKDLVESFHLYLKLFDCFLKEKGTFLTHKKKVRKTVKKSKSTLNSKICPIEIPLQQAETLWEDEISVSLSARMQGRDGGLPDLDAIPFDAISEVPVEEQIIQALAVIQRLLRCNQTGEAVAYLRAARDSWPDENKFGAIDMSIEDEFMCIRDIYFTEFPNEVLQVADVKMNEMEPEQHEEIVEEEIEEQSRIVQQGEKVFELKSFLKMLARPHIVAPYCYLLKSYDQNKEHSNHCIIKMLHRIAVDLEAYPMLFQLSLFMTFKKILSEPKLDCYKEIQGFAKFILCKFFEVYKSNPMVVVELLFWKSNTECYEIIEGYGSLESKRNSTKHSEVGKWTFEEEQELMDFFEEFKETDDVIEKISERLMEKGRTTKQIRNKLVRLHLIEKAHRRKANEWTEDETDEIRRLYEEFKETNEPITNILNSKTCNKSKKAIISHLLEIGLVSDRKDLQKKRKKKKTVNIEKDVDTSDHELIVDEQHVNSREELSDLEGDAGSDSNMEGDNGPFRDDNAGAEQLPFFSSLSQVLRKLRDEGFANEIDWIKSRFTRLANEREVMEEDDWQSIPLVPITEDHENALSNKLFQKMLKTIGISPPANEQETFWRISASLSPSELRDFADDLGKFLKPDISLEERQQVPRAAEYFISESNSNKKDESDDDIFENFVAVNRRRDIVATEVDTEIQSKSDNVNFGNSEEEFPDANLITSEEKPVERATSLPATDETCFEVNVDSVNWSAKTSIKRSRDAAFVESTEGTDMASDGSSDETARKEKRRKKVYISDDNEDDIEE